MKTTKRLTALVLAVLMLLSIASPGAWISDVHAAEIPHSHFETTFINPLYADVLTEDDLVHASHDRHSVQPTDEETTSFYNPYGAGTIMRPDLVARDETITAYVYVDTFDGTQEAFDELCWEVVAYGMMHTGVPTEGDYLLWQFGGYEAEAQYGQDEDGTYLFIIDYTFTYYTTAAQEAEMDTAVAALLTELDAADGDNYTKLKTIYDYICANVVYDDEHVNNQDYELQYTAYAALVDGVAVCQGYSVLLYRLALELGVDVRVITGDGGGPHAWNIGQIGDLYYNMDSTWDAGYTDYDYFLVCPANFTDHIRDAEYDSDDFHEAYPMADEDYVYDICDHVYEGVVTTEPTCTASGVMTYTCSVCGDSYTEEIPATGHTMGETSTTAPTCTEEGVSTSTCTVCGFTVTETTPATGHSWDEGVTTAPTCTEAGSTTYTCTVCGEINVTDEVDALGHNFNDGVTTTAPTCTSEGIMTYTCATCGKTVDEAIAMTEHTYDDGVVTTAPTCTAEGVMTYTCTGCGLSYTEAIPMTAHTYDDGVVTDPTCTEQGYTTFTCTGCGTSYQDLFMDELGHSYDNGITTTEPTCTETGTKTYTCARCANTINEIVDALGHTYDDGVETLAPTCTEEGVMTYTCIHGDDSYTEAIPALGHTKNEGTVAKEATCTETGVMAYVCTVCSAEFTEEIPMIDHNFVDGECTVCGEIQLIAPTIVSCYSKSQTSVKVTWTTVAGAEGYKLWRSTNPDDYSSWTVVKTISDGSVDHYTNQGLTEGVTYYYAVQAFLTDSNGEEVCSEYSNMHYMPAAVVFDGPYSNSTFRIRLRWHEVDGAHGYQIWRQLDDGEYTVVKTIGDRGNEFTTDAGGTTAYSNTSLEAGKKYTYKMRAYMFTEDGRRIWGTFSDEITVAVKPEIPTLTGTSPKATRAKLTWNIPAGSDGFQIWMATSPDGTFSVSKTIDDGTATSYTQYNLTSGQTYYFKVRAYSEGQYKLSYSEFSEVISVTVK